MECSCISLAEIDQKIFLINFWWALFNIFIGGLFGSSLTRQLEAILKEPGEIVTILGKALPSTSSVFFSFAVTRAVFIAPLRLFMPVSVPILFNMGRALLQMCGIMKYSKANTRLFQDRLSPRSCRYGWQLGVHILMLVIGCVFAVPSPIILPAVAAYFILAWGVARFQALYYFVRAYESGGAFWPLVFIRMEIVLGVALFFLGCILLFSQAYVQCAMVWLLLLFMREIHEWIRENLGGRSKYVPLATARAAPEAADSIDPELYTPPALRKKHKGWHPDVGKAWIGYRMVKFTF